MDEQTAQLFLSNTFTRHEATRRLQLIKDLVNYRLFDCAPGTDLATILPQFKQKLEGELEQAHTEADLQFIGTLGEKFINNFNPTRLSEQFQVLEDLIKNCKLVMLYIPFEIPEVEIKKLGVWFKQNLGNNSLFEIEFDSNLIGGCAISYNGIYRDYSIKQRIDDNKKRVLDILLSYRKGAHPS